MNSPDDNLQASGPQTLARSLQILSELVASVEPVSATALAEKVGLHQSSVSRILSTLTAAGFVRKPDYHHFAADYGLLTFAAKAIHQFPLIQHTLPVLRELAPACAPLQLTVATLWRDEVLYLVRVQPGSDAAIMPLMRFPLHLSSPGLRMLLELPGDEALTALEHSRAELGWDRPTLAVPATAAELLKHARERLELDVLALDGWQQPDRISTAIPIRLATPGGGKAAPLAALSLSGGSGAMPLDRIRALLHQGARAIETALAQAAANATVGAFAP
ncbi:MAG TPA: helix-turn-helix domain-containing protein [Planctomycetota bacterium]|nr:helix-turn-helix domain-containing protein [Planctomycetota bacterium]